MNAIEEHQEPTYFIEANKVIFQVKDLADQPDDFKQRLIASLRAFLRPEGSGSSEIESNKESQDRPWRSMINVPTSEEDLRVIEFSPPPQAPGAERFSLIPLQLERLEDNLEPDDVLKVLNDAYTELGDSFIKSQGEGEGKPGEDKFKPLNLNNRIGLVSFSPNWLGGSLPHTKPTGGPGSLPASTPGLSRMQHRFELRGSGALDSLSRFRGEGVKREVVVFDAVPAREVDEFPDAVKDIFTADPPMEVFRYPTPNADFPALPPYWVPQNEHYDKSDHGTFIVSIIRSITPSTKIYLYEVLNRYGDGSFVTVSHGITEALNRHGKGDTKLVFNFSLGMVHELPKHKSLQEPLEELYPKLYPRLWESLIQELIFRALQDAFAQVTAHSNITVVASAGNDANPENKESEEERGPRPFAWYPAAFENVLSVAALSKNYPRDKMKERKFKPASYANSAQSEKPKDKAYSFATFGGERKNGKGNPYAPVDGVLGVYMGVIPTENPDGSVSQDGPDNPTCEAEWSGSSFAAPIISALIAAQENELVYGSLNNTRPYLSTADENVIRVHQV